MSSRLTRSWADKSHKSKKRLLGKKSNGKNLNKGSTHSTTKKK